MRRVLLAAPQVVVGALQDPHLGASERARQVPELPGGTELVLGPGQQQDGPRQRAELRPLGERGDLHLTGPERRADQCQCSGPVVVERGAHRDDGPERPPRQERRDVRRPLAHQVDRGADVAHLEPTASVGAARAHHPAEVEGEDREAAVSELVPKRPQDRMVLAPAVPGMRVAEHRRRQRLPVGGPEFPLQTDAVLRDEAHRLHRMAPWQPWRRAGKRQGFALRGVTPWERIAGVVREGSGSATSVCSCPRSPAAATPLPRSPRDRRHGDAPRPGDRHPPDDFATTPRDRRGGCRSPFRAGPMTCPRRSSGGSASSVTDRLSGPHRGCRGLDPIHAHSPRPA